jgi:site-specific DNA-methyltransferase (adenine-specific)
VNDQVICGDLRDVLPDLDQRFTMCFMDPPDGINLNYNSFSDQFEDYYTYLEEVVRLVIARCDISWLSFNAIWLPVVGSLVRQLCREKPELKFKPCVQTFTFGQTRQTDLGNGHRPLWRLAWEGSTLYPDAIRVPSWRQLNGDRRADPRGRVPLDVFDVPRVTGNSKQRRKWHPTQIGEDLVERCVKLSTVEGDSVLDGFSGTGTTLRVCKRLNRTCTAIEIDPMYCEKIRKENHV